MRTIAAVDGLRLDRHVLVRSDLARGPSGELWWLMREPAAREWRNGAGLLSERGIEWRLLQDGEDVVLRVAEPGGEADVLDLRGAAAEAFLEADDEPLTVIGPYRPIRGPRDVAAHITARGPLLPAFGPGRRRLTEQLGLSLYRIARWRGGPFWDATAQWLAEWGVARAGHLEAQTELRFVTDLAMLLLAAGESGAAERVLDDLEKCAVPLGDGTWYRHDREEVVADRNDLVLNTHLYTLVALAAGGRSVAAGQRALTHALSHRAPRGRGAALAAGIALTDLAIAAGFPMGKMAWQLHRRWADFRRDHRHLTLVPGLVARDATGAAAGRYYRTVNLADLAAVVCAAPSPHARAALRSGLNLARASGFFRVQRISGAYATVVIPSLLRMAGHHGPARRTAARAREAGWAPTIGWPGYEDALWPALPPGIP